MSIFGVKSPTRKHPDDEIRIISHDDTDDSNNSMYGESGVRTPKRRSQARCTAASNFYDSCDVNPALLRNTELSETIDDIKAHNVKLSKRLPQSLKAFLALVLGIKRRPDDNIWCGLLLNTFTVMLSIVFSLTGAWYKIFDIRSDVTKTTVVTGTVSLVIGIAWVSLGIYAHDLAGRLLSSRMFSENVRLHSKTIFRISVALLLLLLGGVTIALDCYETYYIMVEDVTCSQVQVPNFVCYISYGTKIGISFFTLVWNILVGYIMLSVCRTHTVVIRKFMRELAIDAKAIEKAYFMDAVRITQNTFEESSAFISPERFTQGNSNPDYADKWIMWDEDDLLDQVKPGKTELRSVPDDGSSTKSRSKSSAGPDKNEDVNEEANKDTGTKEYRRYPSLDSDIPDGTSILTNDDILISYWKISRRMRVTSRYLQRWMASWILFVFIWCTDLIIYWTSHEATLPGILQFTLPLLMLLLISSAYAEANAEGQRMLRCICPKEERLGLVFFLSQQPLQMQVFNFGITYQALTGVLLAFSVAFASRMILDEVNKK